MERDIIQRPELLLRLQRRFGLRQAHVSPTLGSTVQPVAIVEDLTKLDVQSFRYLSGWAGPSGSAVVPTDFVLTALHNPPNSGVRGQLIKTSIQHQTFNAGGLLVPARIFFTFFPVGTVTTSPTRPDLFQPGTAFWNDQGRTGNGALSVRHNVQAVIPGNVHFNIFLNSGINYDWTPSQFYLPPNSAVVIGSEENSAAAHTDEFWTSWDWLEEPIT